MTAAPESPDRRAAERRARAVLGGATVATGLMAGLFYAFDVSVMPGLRRTDDRTFVDSMRHINRAIENPLFAAAYGGALLAPVAAAVLSHRAGKRRAARWTAGAVACYGVALALTNRVNVPLNKALELAADGSASAARAAFEQRWTTANIARTVATTAALACLGKAFAAQDSDAG